MTLQHIIKKLLNGSGTIVNYAMADTSRSTADSYDEYLGDLGAASPYQFGTLTVKPEVSETPRDVSAKKKTTFDLSAEHVDEEEREKGGNDSVKKGLGIHQFNMLLRTLKRQSGEDAEYDVGVEERNMIRELSILSLARTLTFTRDKTEMSMMSRYSTYEPMEDQLRG